MRRASTAWASSGRACQLLLGLELERLLLGQDAFAHQGLVAGVLAFNNLEAGTGLVQIGLFDTRLQLEQPVADPDRVAAIVMDPAHDACHRTGHGDLSAGFEQTTDDRIGRGLYPGQG